MGMNFLKSIVLQIFVGKYNYFNDKRLKNIKIFHFEAYFDRQRRHISAIIELSADQCNLTYTYENKELLLISSKCESD